MSNQIEIEQRVLWAILLSPELLEELVIDDTYFTNIYHKTILKALREMINDNMPIDIISLRTKLLGTKEFDIATLMDIISWDFTTASFNHYVSLLKKNGDERALNTISNNIHRKIESWTDIYEIMHYIRKELDWIEQNSLTTDVDMYWMIEQTYDWIEEIKEWKKAWWSFGKELTWLDQLTGGIIPWKIYRIGGWSNVGKSWLLYNIIMSLIRQKVPTTFFALENDNIFTMKNLFWLKKWVNSLPDVIAKEKWDFTSEVEWFIENNTFILSDRVEDIKDLFRQALKNRSKVICIDYIELVNMSEKFPSEERRLNEYSITIQKWAKKYKIAVIDLSQLSNTTQKEWIDWAGRWEFKGSWWLKAWIDVWIHLFTNKDKENLKQSAIEDGKSDWRKKSFIDLVLTKNRLGWWVGFKQPYVLDFNIWGRYVLDIY